LLIAACPLRQKTSHITGGICQVRGPLEVVDSVAARLPSIAPSDFQAFGMVCTRCAVQR
jgi:hypothetical protein